MKTKIIRKLPVFLLILLLSAPVVAGCHPEKKLPDKTKPYVPPSPSQLSSTMVPNVPLDVYIYARQDKPTKIPADMVGLRSDVELNGSALWGVSSGDDFAFGAGITLTSAGDASRIYNEMQLRKDAWKMLSGDTIYVVMGSGSAAESLKTAISKNDFKHFDNAELINAAATLPDSSANKPAAVGVAKLSKTFLDYVARETGSSSQAAAGISMAMNLARIEAVAFGLYSPQQIDVAELKGLVEKGGNISSLNLGLLAYLKSGLPAFLAEPGIKQFLKEADFTETTLGELSVLKGALDIGGGNKIPVLIIIEGSRIFAALAAQESYAETLIKSIKK